MSAGAVSLEALRALHPRAPDSLFASWACRCSSSSAILVMDCCGGPSLSSGAWLPGTFTKEHVWSDRCAPDWRFFIPWACRCSSLSVVVVVGCCGGPCLGGGAGEAWPSGDFARISMSGRDLHSNRQRSFKLEACATLVPTGAWPGGTTSYEIKDTCHEERVLKLHSVLICRAWIWITKRCFINSLCKSSFTMETWYCCERRRRQRLYRWRWLSTLWWMSCCRQDRRAAVYCLCKIESV